MLRLLHDEDLVDDELLPRLMREIHLLDRDFLASQESFGDIHVSGSTKVANTAQKQKQKAIPSASISLDLDHETRATRKKRAYAPERRPRVEANLRTLTR